MSYHSGTPVGHCRRPQANAAAIQEPNRPVDADVVDEGAIAAAGIDNRVDLDSVIPIERSVERRDGWVGNADARVRTTPEADPAELSVTGEQRQLGAVATKEDGM